MNKPGPPPGTSVRQDVKGNNNSFTGTGDVYNFTYNILGKGFAPDDPFAVEKARQRVAAFERLAIVFALVLLTFGPVIMALLPAPVSVRAGIGISITFASTAIFAGYLSVVRKRLQMHIVALAGAEAATDFAAAVANWSTLGARFSLGSPTATSTIVAIALAPMLLFSVLPPLSIEPSPNPPVVATTDPTLDPMDLPPPVDPPPTPPVAQAHPPVAPHPKPSTPKQPRDWCEDYGYGYQFPTYTLGDESQRGDSSPRGNPQVSAEVRGDPGAIGKCTPDAGDPGRLPPESIQRILNAHLLAAGPCTPATLRPADIDVKFTISPSGAISTLRVTYLAYVGATESATYAAHCLADRLMSDLEFPEVPNSKVTVLAPIAVY